MDAYQRIRIEDDGKILLFYDTDTNELLAKYPVTEGTGQIFKPEGNNNRNRVTHALIKQYTGYGQIICFLKIPYCQYVLKSYTPVILPS